MKIESLEYSKAREYLESISCLKSLVESPNHFKVAGDDWMFYVDRRNSLDPLDRRCKITIMQWDLPSRPHKTFQEFFESAKPETQACFAFHLDMFR
jgi:hypothetical protein